MNILFVHSIGKEKFGGGEKWLITAASGLRDKGHRVFVGARPGSGLLKAAQHNGLETVNLNILSDMSPWHVFRIASFLKTHKIDVIITRGRELAVSGVAARLGGNPVVLVRHGSPMQSSFRKHAFLHKRLADGVITNTRTIRELLERKGVVEKGFTRVIYNGTVATEDSPPYDFSLKFPGRKIILTVGRLAAPKGYYYLIDAIAMLRKKHDDVMFVFLGKGKLYRKLVAYAGKKGVSDLIHFEGFVENVAPYLKGCDIFVLPSLYEGMPNAAMEAMAYGKPVILTGVYGAGELIPDGEKGVLIPPRDAGAIAVAMERLLNDRKLCDRMGDEARKHVMANFTVSAMIDNIESYIEEKIQEKNS